MPCPRWEYQQIVPNTPDQLSTIRFSLRWALAAMTVVAVGAMAVTPWVRRWDAQQVRWAALLAVAAGLLLGVAVMLGSRRRAQRRAGALAGIVRQKWHSVQVVALMPTLFLIAMVSYSLWSIDAIGASPGRTRTLLPILHFWLPAEFAFVAVLLWTNCLPVHVREKGLVFGFLFRPWKRVISYCWEDDEGQLYLLLFGQPIVGHVAEAERPQVEALLAREVDASLN